MPTVPNTVEDPTPDSSRGEGLRGRFVTFFLAAWKALRVGPVGTCGWPGVEDTRARRMGGASQARRDQHARRAAAQ